MYPQPVMSAPAQNVSGGEASTFILVGLIFQILSSIGVFLIVFFFFVIGSFLTFFLAIAIGIAALTIFMLYVAIDWSYLRAKNGNYEGARGPTLLLGILGIPFGWVITGVFYLVAYSKLEDAIRERSTPLIPMPMTVVPAGAVAYAPAPMYMVAPAAAAPLPSSAGGMGAAPPALAPFCAKCGRPTTLVPQYGRYYCYTDQLYA